MSTQRKWSIRAYRDGDEYGIFELWKLILSQGEEIPEQWMRWWNWRYKENPAGAGIVWLAEHAGKIVGQYALIPVQMKIGNETFLTAHSLDTMTHPDYTRQGMFTTLAKKAYEDATGRGIKIVHGFPNSSSHPGFIGRLEWFDVVRRQIWVKPFSWKNALGLVVKNSLVSSVLGLGASLVFNKVVTGERKAPSENNLEICEVSSFDDRIDTFWNKVSNQYQIMSVRNRDYLNWRYVAAPNVTYSILIAENSGEICGYLVSRVKQWGSTSLGIIFDILSESEYISRCLFSRAMTRLENDGADTVFCRIIAGSQLRGALKKSGFITVPAFRQVPFGVRSFVPEYSQEYLENPNNWYIQVGDSDWM